MLFTAKKTVLSKHTVKEIQEVLRGLGMYKGGIDGILGKRTSLAVRSFQKINSLHQDGIIGLDTLKALFPLPIVDRTNPPKVVSKPFIAPSKGPIVSPWPRQKDVVGFYGGVGAHQTMLTLPFPMVLAWDKRRVVQRISLHEKCAESARRAFVAILKHYGLANIESLGLNVFGGSFNVRKMRGGTNWSMHSWGIAIDFDPEFNQLKWASPKARLSGREYIPFWNAWEAEGWVSLGRTRNYDWMHVQAARL